MNTVFSTALLSLFTMFGTPKGDAQAPYDGARKANRGHHGKVCEKLECTDAQKAAIKDIQAEHRAETADEREAAKALRAKFKQARSAEPVDAKLLATIKAEMKALRATMKNARTATNERINTVLTPEQVATLEAFRAERKAKHEAKKGRKGKRGDEAKRGKGKRADGTAKRSRNGKGDKLAKRGRKSQRGRFAKL